MCVCVCVDNLHTYVCTHVVSPAQRIPLLFTDTPSLEEREKQIERRRKAALFIEELRRKRELQLEEEKEPGVNEDSDEFVGPKRKPVEL